MANARYPSPCLVCKRVRNPKACNNKNCEQWQQWFIGRWETVRQQLQQELARLPQAPAGVNIGGRRYATPHQMREFLQDDPCARCPRNNASCTAPCQVRRVWEQAKREVCK